MLSYFKNPKNLNWLESKIFDDGKVSTYFDLGQRDPGIVAGLRDWALGGEGEATWMLWALGRGGEATWVL